MATGVRKSTTKASTKKTPEKKPPKERKAIVARDRKDRDTLQTHKLSADTVEFILVLTLSGWRVPEIIAELKKQFGITVSDRTITYQRKVNRARLLATLDEDIADARIARPEGMLPAGRMETLCRAIVREEKKTKPSAMGIATLVGTQNQLVYQTEMLRLRLREYDKKYPAGKEGEGERILRELERRSHVMRDITEEVNTMKSIAGGNFQDIEAKAEVVPDDAPEAEKEPEAPAAAPEAQVMGEDVLTR